MKKAWEFLQAAAWIALLAAFALGLISIFRAMGGTGQAPGSSATSQSQGYPPPATPAEPVATLPPGLTPIFIPPGQAPFIPTLTPLPTITPYPTPKPAPVFTVPASVPAKDAGGTVFYLSRNDNAVDLLALPVDASVRPQGKPVKLPVNGEPSWAVSYASPDNNRIALIGGVAGVEAGDVIDIVKFINPHTDRLFRTRAGGSGVFLNWHPDSRHILYRTDVSYVDQALPGIWLVDTETGQIASLLTQNPSEAISSAAISPDGQKLVYSLQADLFAPGEVWLANADGSQARLIHTAASDVFGLTWSPTGQQIAYVGDGGVSVMDADGQNARVVGYNFAVGFRWQPIWSPAGKTLAFVAFDGPPGNTGNWDVDAFQGTTIHIVEVTTGQERSLLSDGSLGNIDPAWSPDGSQIAFVSNRSGHPEIWAVRADGADLHALTATSQIARFPVWRRP